VDTVAAANNCQNNSQQQATTAQLPKAAYKTISYHDCQEHQANTQFPAVSPITNTLHDSQHQTTTTIPASLPVATDNNHDSQHKNIAQQILTIPEKGSSNYDVTSVTTFDNETLAPPIKEINAVEIGRKKAPHLSLSKKDNLKRKDPPPLVEVSEHEPLTKQELTIDEEIITDNESTLSNKYVGLYCYFQLLLT
jgi:hypothetical protein